MTGWRFFVGGNRTGGLTCWAFDGDGDPLWSLDQGTTVWAIEGAGDGGLFVAGAPNTSSVRRLAPDLSVLWTANLGARVTRLRALSDGTLLAAHWTAAGNINARRLDAADGAILDSWAIPAGHATIRDLYAIEIGPAGSLFGGSSYRAFRYDLAADDWLWDSPGGFARGVAWDGGDHVAVACQASGDAADGRRLHHVDGTSIDADSGGATGRDVAWHPSDGFVFAYERSGGHSIRLLDKADWDTVWQYDTGGNALAIATDSQGHVYYGGIRANALTVGMLDADGLPVWAADTGGTIQTVATDFGSHASGRWPEEIDGVAVPPSGIVLAGPVPLPATGAAVAPPAGVLALAAPEPAILVAGPMAPVAVPVGALLLGAPPPLIDAGLDGIPVPPAGIWITAWPPAILPALPSGALVAPPAAALRLRGRVPMVAGGVSSAPHNLLSFAWVHGEDRPFDPKRHDREDLAIFALEIEHREGDVPAALLEVRNPGTGLLQGGAPRHAWIGWRTPGGPVLPLFFGRLTGFPRDLAGETVGLEFLAQVPGWSDQRAALADSLKQAPWWDPVFIPEAARDDPDEVLEARSARWHVDRVSGETTISDILAAEDGLVDLEGLHFRDSLRVDIDGAPLRRVRVVATVEWEQAQDNRDDPSIDKYYDRQIFRWLPRRLREGYVEGPTGDAGWDNRMYAYTARGLIADAPPEGSEIGARAGYTVGSPTGGRLLTGTAYPPSIQGEDIQVGIGQFVALDHRRFHLDFTIDWQVSRPRKEVLALELQAEVQPLIDADLREQTVELFAQDPVGDGGFDPGRRSYFLTQRGRRSTDYLACVARAVLAQASRLVAIAVEIPLADAIAADLSCRKAARIVDDRLPGGAAVGKIVAYRLVLDGEGGAGCVLTIACAVGVGTGSGVDGGAAGGGLDHAGAAFPVMPVDGQSDLAWIDYRTQEPEDDGVELYLDEIVWPPDPTVYRWGPLSDAELVLDAVTANNRAEQEAFAQANAWPEVASWAELSQRIDQQAATRCRVELMPLVSEPFEHAIAVATLPWVPPRQIDLED